MPKFKSLQLVGQVFTNLTVLEEAGKDSHGAYLWLCQCSCGNTRTVVGSELVREAMKSCGCLRIITHCKHGHEYISENTYLDKKGTKRCRECQRSREKNRVKTPKFIGPRHKTGRKSQTHCIKGHEFTVENTYLWGGHKHCRKCSSVRTGESARKDPNHLQKRRDRRKYHRAPSDSPEAKRETLLKAIGWTPEMFERVLIEQDNKCATCNKEMNLEKKQNGGRACPDHVHITPPKPRGILCSVCNLALGLLKENPETMKAMIKYTLKYREEG